MTFRNGILAGAVILSMLAGCASQRGTAASSQVTSADSADKCEVDARRVCQELRNAPVVGSGSGRTLDQIEREQNSARTASEFFSYQIPGGALVSVECEINTEHSTVVYAHLMPGAPLTATDISYIREHGYCAHQ
jgi:hypothetical protein